MSVCVVRVLPLSVITVIEAQLQAFKQENRVHVQNYRVFLKRQDFRVFDVLNAKLDFQEAFIL